MHTPRRHSLHSRGLFLFIVALVVASQTGWGAPPGVVDTTFDTDGKQTIDFTYDDRATAVVVQPDSKIVVVGSSDGGSSDFALARLNPDGSPDTTFSADGKFTVSFSGADFAQAVALQLDGKIVVAGYTNSGGGLGANDFAIARVNPDGTLDTTFDGDGRQNVDFTYDDRAMGIAIRNDGKIIVAGFSDGGTADFAVARLNTNGSLDATFSGDGRHEIDFIGVSAEFGRAVVLDESGRIVIAGYSNSGGGVANNFAIARLTPGGVLDGTFNGNGMLTIDIVDDDRANSVAIQPDGKIVIGGWYAEAGLPDFAVARVSESGVLDTSFSVDGKASAAIGVGAADRSTGLALLHNGKIALGGWTTAGGGVGASNFAVALFNPDGIQDTTFATNGGLIVDVGGNDQTGGLAVQPDGQLVLAGFGNVGPGAGANNFALVRVGADPPLDLTFDADGRQTTDLLLDDQGRAVIIQPDGKVVVAGSRDGGAANFAIARYNTNGSPDASFDGDGDTNITFGSQEFANAMARQADGKLVVVGYTNNGPGVNNFAVIRLTVAGALDTTFNPSAAPTATDGNGRLTIDFGFDDRATGVAIQLDGKIVIGGFTDGGPPSADFALARLNFDGSLDGTFSGDGKMLIDFGTQDFAHAVAIQPDGHIVIAGVANVNMAIARVTPAGILDVTFDTDGRQTTSFGGPGSSIESLAIQPDGKIVCAGSLTAADTDFVLVRYNANGSLDATFSNDGRQTLSFGASVSGSADFARSVALQQNGKIVVVGFSNAGPALGVYDFAIARLNTNGELDTSFNGTGRLLIDFGNDDRANGVAIVPATGAIVVTGFTSRGQDFATLRLPGDAPPAIPTLTVNDVLVTEGNAGVVAANFTVSLSGPVVFSVTVDVATANGSGTAPADYAVVPTTNLLFPPGTTTRTVTVSVNGDTVDEPLESFLVDLSNPVGALIADPQGIGLITDDDLAVTITSPTGAPATTASVSFLALAGTAADIGGIANVTWVNDRGGSGTAIGTTNWSIPGVPLASGANLIAVQAHDAFGNTTIDTLTVTVASLAYYLAEGATGAFFDYDLVLANPTGVAAPVSTTFLNDDGTTVVDARVLPPTSRTTIRVDDIPGLGSTAVSAVVTSTAVIPIIVERSMYWDGTYYGGHAGSSVPAPATTWLFGEGSQGFFDTYVLLANANAAPVDVTVTFLLEAGAPVVKNYTVAPTSRFNCLRRRDSGARQPVVLDCGDVDDPDHRRAGDVFRVAAVQRRPRIGGGEYGVDDVVPRRGGDGPVLRHVHPGGEPEPGARDGDLHVPLVERGVGHEGEGDTGEHAAHGERGAGGCAAGGHGGVDDGDVGSAGDFGAGDVLAGGVHVVVRGAQQLRGDADGDEVGVGGGAVGRAVQLPDLHPAGESEPDDGGDRADYVPEDRRDDAGEELRGQSDVAVQRGRQRDGAGAGRGAVWRAD